jgi:hypothetical protein
MKKFILLLLVLTLAGGAVSAQDSEVIIRGGGGVLFFQSLYGYTEPSISSLRVGVHGDVMYNMGRFEVGAEIGVYAMEVEYWYGYNYYDYFLAVDIPINALFRMNFDRSRMFALEARAGLWLTMITDGYEDEMDLDLNIGARAALGFFYFGVDYIAGLNLHYPALAFEAGVKFAFE